MTQATPTAVSQSLSHRGTQGDEVSRTVGNAVALGPSESPRGLRDLCVLHTAEGGLREPGEE